MKPHLDRPKALPRDVGDLAVRQSLLAAQQQDRAIARLQAGQRTVDRPTHLGDLRATRWRRLVDRRLEDLPCLLTVARRRFERDRRGASAAQVVDGPMMRNAQQPAREPPAGLISVEPGERTDEDLLRQVFGQGWIADHPLDHRENFPLVTLDKNVGGARRAGEERRDLPVVVAVDEIARLTAGGLLTAGRDRSSADGMKRSNGRI